MHMFNTSKTVDTSHEQQTKIRQDELIKKEKARLNRIKANSMTKEEEDELYKKNKKIEEIQKKSEYNKVKEWLIKDKGFKEEQITDKLIEDSKNDYSDLIFDEDYADDYTIRKYNEDGTYTLYRDNAQEEIDRTYREEMSRNKSQTCSGEAPTKLYEYGVTYKLTEYTSISGGLEFNKIPELFITKKSLLILKNNDNKCFLYCYIRESLNPITKK